MDWGGGGRYLNLFLAVDPSTQVGGGGVAREMGRGCFSIRIRTLSVLSYILCDLSPLWPLNGCVWWPRWVWKWLDALHERSKGGQAAYAASFCRFSGPHRARMSGRRRTSDREDEQTHFDPIPRHLRHRQPTLPPRRRRLRKSPRNRRGRRTLAPEPRNRCVERADDTCPAWSQ
jgi:hypothetical protein